MKERFNSLIEKDEVLAKNGKLSIEDIVAAIASVKNFAKLGSLNEVEKEQYINKFTSIAETAGISKDSLDKAILKSENEARNVKVKATELENIKKRMTGRVAAIAAAVGITVGAIGAISAFGGKEEQPVVNATQAAEKDTDNTTMDEEYQQIADDSLAFAQNVVDNGLPENAQITEENKEKMTESLVEYYLLNQMDELTDEQWANIFQNSTFNADDLMNSKASWEWIDEQRVTVSENHLDYSLLFDGADAELLNDAAGLLNTVRTSTGSEKETAQANFKNYVLEKLGSENNRMQYSERALDTFRAIYFDAFDELTNHAVVDDELEHAINTTITCSISESSLNVEDADIKSLQSEFETYEYNKLDTRLQNGWNFVALNNDDINEYNDISYIVEYVAANIDLSKQFILPDYETTLANMFLVNDGKGKSVHDSGVSDGKGGIISNDPNGGIRPGETKEQYEARIESQDAQTAEASESITDASGNVIVPSDGNSNTDESADYAAGYKAGYEDGNSGKGKNANGSNAYNKGYEAGYAKGLADKEALDNSLSNDTTEEFQSVEEQTVEESVSVSTQSFQAPATPEAVTTSNVAVPTAEENTNISSLMEEFVPVEDATEEVVEESEITEYTYDASADIAALEALKSELLGETTYSEETYTNDSVKTL